MKKLSRKVFSSVLSFSHVCLGALSPGVSLAAPKADLPQDKIEEGRLLAEKIYRQAGCQGLARVDFFLDEAGKYWFNEINPFPGFTSISIYPKVWEEKGSLFELMDSFVILALERFRLQEKIFSFSCKSLVRA